MEHISIIYEDKDFVAVDKPAGLLVHSVPGRAENAEATLVEQLLSKYPEIKNVGDDPSMRPGIVHRLDKETSGILLVARTQTAFEYLKALFKRREIKKEYLALVWGTVRERTGTIRKPISLKSGTTRHTVYGGKMEKIAVTNYSVKHYFNCNEEKFSLLAVFPETGRTHQIRVHLASIGHPVVGDKLYGRKNEPMWISRLMLHALVLEFHSLNGTRFKLEAEIPASFSEVLARLQLG